MYLYMVNGEPQTFLGMGYNPIYRDLSSEERAANYHRDFKILCEAGINHITGWDADKGYEQDKFDELMMDIALQYGIGVLMAINLLPEGNYRDPAYVEALKEHATEKVLRYKNHPGLRMWGVGNEVLTEMPREMYAAFAGAYLQIIDLVHDLDPNHPVIYREAEDLFVAAIKRLLERRGERPWFLYGMNIYSLELERVLDDWPRNGFNRPLFVTEFGANPTWLGGRAPNYVGMWRMIRAHPHFALGGAPYVWTTEGPEPGDKKWGLMDGQSIPVDETFEQLAQEWRREPDNDGRVCPS
ncbi:MAG: hypothetical protein HYY02_13855 [Chloroflexi bacterium]|nr:hypothetical protein [Chloroflexota bacterium]